MAEIAGSSRAAGARESPELAPCRPLRELPYSRAPWPWFWFFPSRNPLAFTHSNLGCWRPEGSEKVNLGNVYVCMGVLQVLGWSPEPH